MDTMERIDELILLKQVRQQMKIDDLRAVICYTIGWLGTDKEKYAVLIDRLEQALTRTGRENVT